MNLPGLTCGGGSHITYDSSMEGNGTKFWKAKEYCKFFRKLDLVYFFDDFSDGFGMLLKGFGSHYTFRVWLAG